jgi:two-component system nitrate/nitrite response regulator NarL
VNDLRILVVADDPLARSGLATLLADQPSFTVAGQVAGDADLLGALDVYQPDVIVWDMGWDPTLSSSTDSRTALEDLIDVGKAAPPLAVLLPDERYAAEVWVLGARGLLLRDVDSDRLVATLAAIVQGLVVLDPELASSLLAAQDLSLTPLVEELTPRELEVLQLLAEGLPNKSIARRLEISEHTVKFHVNAIMGKLGAQSRTQVVVRATRLGLILL